MKKAAGTDSVGFWRNARRQLKGLMRRIAFAIPITKAIWIAYSRSKAIPSFAGWGMRTEHHTPWDVDAFFGDTTVSDFQKVNSKIVAAATTGKINLSQFKNESNLEGLLQELTWRHYIVFWTARFAVRNVAEKEKNLVECGVCDGLTLHFAMDAIKADGLEFKAFAYDAWEGMREQDLLDAEKSSTGAYSYLSIDNTKNNLIDFQNEVTFIKGNIPASFANATRPDAIAWLHIDLNSSQPTTAALEFFFNKIAGGGVVLFDDYGWHGQEETKKAVDIFFKDKPGMLFPLPTGQAIFFKF